MKKHTVNFYLEAYIFPGSEKHKERNVSLEKSYEGFPFLPTEGMNINLSWSSEADVELVVSHICLWERENEFEWDVTLRDTKVPKNRVPEIHADVIDMLIKDGWKVE